MVPLALLPLTLIVQTLPSTAPEPGSALSAPVRSCAAGPTADGDVVVCARPRDADRLKPLPSLAPEQRFDPLSFRLPGGASTRIHGFQRGLSGATSQGVALTTTIPLGRKRRDDGGVR